MRLIIAMRQKGTVQTGDNKPLRKLIGEASAILDRVQPWPEENTRLNLRWFTGTGSTAVLFRSNEPKSSPMREGWIGNKGRIWAWTGIVSAAFHEQLKAAEATDHRIFDVAKDAVGSFALIGATEDTITVTTNAHRSEAMYYGETADAVIFTNSAAALNLLINNGRPSYSRIGIAGALVHGLPVTESTIFADVSIAPAGTTISSDPAHDLRFKKHDPDYRDLEVNLDQLAGEIAESLVDYARTLSAGGGGIRAAITGGKDSRLVVAALKAAGLDFHTYTSGLPESGEVEIGKRVSAALGVEQKILVPPMRRAANGKQVVIGTPELQAWRTLRSTGGLGNAFTAMPSPDREHSNISDGINFGGQGGEIVRGGYLRNLPKDEINRDTARAYFVRTWLNNQDLLQPWAREAMVLDLKRSFDLASDRPYASLFRGYVHNRTGRWLATMRHGESVINSHTTLLINNQMVHSMLSVNPKLLVDEWLAFKVMRILSPELVEIPFFRDRWSFELNGPHESFKPESWDSREPYTAHKQPRATFNWRSSYSKAFSNYIKDFIFSSEDSPLHEVIDRRAVENMLDGKKYRAPAAWALFSTQYALTNAWLDATPPESPVEIAVEVPR